MEQQQQQPQPQPPQQQQPQQQQPTTTSKNKSKGGGLLPCGCQEIVPSVGLFLRAMAVIFMMSLFLSVIIVSVALTETLPGDLVTIRHKELFSQYFSIDGYPLIIFGVIMSCILLVYFLISLSLLMFYGYGIYVVAIFFVNLKKPPGSPPMQRHIFKTPNDSISEIIVPYKKKRMSNSYNGRVKNRRNSSAADFMPVQGIVSPQHHEINSLRDIRNLTAIDPEQPQSFDPVVSHSIPFNNYRHQDTEILNIPEYKPLIDEATRQIKLISQMKKQGVEPPPSVHPGQSDSEFGSDTEDFEYHAYPTPSSLNTERDRLLKLASSNPSTPENLPSPPDRNSPKFLNPGSL